MKPNQDTPNSSTPLRVLHIGNIANNAYNNAKIQRRMGIEADVICFDYYHIMSCPEWEDSGFEGQINDPFKPDWWAVDLKGFKRPDWFAQGPVSHCRNYLNARNTGAITERYWHWRMIFSRWLLVCDNPFVNTVSDDSARPNNSLSRLIGVCRYAFSKAYWGPRNAVTVLIKDFLKSWKTSPKTTIRNSYFSVRKIWRIIRYTIIGTFLRIARQKAIRLLVMVAGLIVAIAGGLAYGIFRSLLALGLISKSQFKSKTLVIDGYKKHLRDLLAKPKPKHKHKHKHKTGKTTALNLKTVEYEDAAQYLSDLAEWVTLYKQYDLIQAYSVDPIRPFLADVKNYTAYEHGTIREIPFIDNALGRLTKASYQDAPVVFVTNSDNITAVKKMGLDPSRVVYLPHAFDETKLLRFKDEHLAFSKLDTNRIELFSPSRQHWRDDNPSMSKRNDKFIRAFARVAADDTRLFTKMVAWGEDLQRSKKLIEDLGIADRVTWIEPLKKRELWLEYLKCHAVVDQFLIPAIGGVAFEAMTLGKRVITSIDLDQNREFFGEPPKMLNCTEEPEIEARIREVLADPTDNNFIGASATEWMITYHSSERVFDLQLRAYQQVLGNITANSTVADIPQASVKSVE